MEVLGWQRWCIFRPLLRTANHLCCCSWTTWHIIQNKLDHSTFFSFNTATKHQISSSVESLSIYHHYQGFFQQWGDSPQNRRHFHIVSVWTVAAAFISFGLNALFAVWWHMQNCGVMFLTHIVVVFFIHYCLVGMRVWLFGPFI